MILKLTLVRDDGEPVYLDSEAIEGVTKYKGLTNVVPKGSSENDEAYWAVEESVEQVVAAWSRIRSGLETRPIVDVSQVGMTTIVTTEDELRSEVSRLTKKLADAEKLIVGAASDLDLLERERDEARARVAELEAECQRLDGVEASLALATAELAQARGGVPECVKRRREDEEEDDG